MGKDIWDTSTLPIYGSLTGVELSSKNFEILSGISLHQIYADTFGATMMAFAPPSSANKHHPEPWAAVRGGFNFESRVEVALENTGSCLGMTPPTVMWLIAAVLRLRVQAPIRLAVIGNMPFEEMGERWKDVQAIPFETAPNQIGAFTSTSIQIEKSEIEWLKDMIPVAAQLYNDERFNRAFSIYEQAQWATTPELGVTLVWTAIGFYSTSLA